MGGIRKSVAHILVVRISYFLVFLTEGMFLAQYKVLRENGHSPSEAFNETVEEATQSLFPLIGAKGFVHFPPVSYGPRGTDSRIRTSFQDGLHVQRVLYDRPPWRSRLGTGV